MDIQDRKIPVSITLTLKHLIAMDKVTTNYSKYIRELIENDNGMKND